MKIRSIKDVDVSGKRVLVRSDLNVPFLDGAIMDDARIRGAMATLQCLIDRGARVVVCAHLGRPKGKPNAEDSLAPVAKRLGELLKKNIALCPDCVGPEVAAALDALEEGDLVVLENTRFHAGETSNDPEFAKQLAAPFDLFVNDAFGTAHRAHASTEGVAHHIPSVAGLLMLEEVEIIRGLRVNPMHPFILILGGAKSSSKLPVLNRLMDQADRILIAGGTCNTFLLARGIEIGQSEFEPDCLKEASDMLARSGDKIVLPVDAVVAPELSADAETRTVPIEEIPTTWRKVDIGPETVRLFAQHLEGAGTVAWNGPLGFTEITPFAEGSRALGEVLAKLDAMTVIGGGDTVAALHQHGLDSAMSHVSTGGGAFFKLLETDDLPALQALR